MARIHRVLGALGLLSLGAASTASAQTYWDVFGGSSFRTHAAGRAMVIGNKLTLQIWNPANSLGFGSPGAVIVGIGLYNVPAGVKFKNGDALVTGSARVGDTPGQWEVGKYNGKKAVELPSGIMDLDMYALAKPGGDGWASNGIAGSCSTGLPPSATETKGNKTVYINHLWQSGLSGCVGGYGAPVVMEIEFEYKKDAPLWNGQADLAVLATNGKDSYSLMLAGQYGNVSVTPEPITMTLLATGLLGLGGAGVIRRRRRQGS